MDEKYVLEHLIDGAVMQYVTGSGWRVYDRNINQWTAIDRKVAEDIIDIQAAKLVASGNGREAYQATKAAAVRLAQITP